jgi:TPR repeat protein
MNDIDFAARVSAPIGQLYGEAKRSLHGFPKHALTQARALASLCCDLLGAPVHSIQRPGLDGQIAELARTHRINPDTYDLLQRVRRAGNAGAHPERAMLDEKQFAPMARQAMIDVRTLLETVFRQRHRGAAVPAYAVLDEPPEPLQELCYRALVSGSAPDQYLVAIHLVDQVAARIAEVRAAGPDLDRFAAQREVDAMRSRAIDLLAYASDAGYAPAHYEYAQALLEGARGEGKEAHASHLMWLACRDEYPDAMAWNGNAVLYGLHGHDVDHEQALVYLEKAAAHDNPGALTLLSRMYREGLGVPPDPVAAFDMTLRAAEAGFPAAQYELSAALFNGHGTARDEAQALCWLDKAVDSAYGPAFAVKAQLIRKGKAPGTAVDVEQLLVAAIPSWNQARLDLADLFIDSKEQDKLVRAAYLVQDCYTQALRDGDKPLVELCLAGAPALIERLEAPVSALSDEQLKEVLMARFQFDEHGRPYPDRLARAKLFFETASALAKAKGVNVREEHRLTQLLASGMGSRAALHANVAAALPRPVTQRYLPNKPGRNDPCPCGSGEKFKRCCA